MKGTGVRTASRHSHCDNPGELNLTHLQGTESSESVNQSWQLVGCWFPGNANQCGHLTNDIKIFSSGLIAAYPNAYKIRGTSLDEIVRKERDVAA